MKSNWIENLCYKFFFTISRATKKNKQRNRQQSISKGMLDGSSLNYNSTKGSSWTKHKFHFRLTSHVYSNGVHWCDIERRTRRRHFRRSSATVANFKFKFVNFHLASRRKGSMDSWLVQLNARKFPFSKLIICIVEPAQGSQLFYVR